MFLHTVDLGNRAKQEMHRLLRRQRVVVEDEYMEDQESPWILIGSDRSADIAAALAIAKITVRRKRDYVFDVPAKTTRSKIAHRRLRRFEAQL